MVSFLFWNLDGKPLQEPVARLVSACAVDIVILAESEIEQSAMIATLQDHGRTGFHYPFSASRKIQVFSRLPKGRVVDRRNDFLAGLNVRNLKVGPPPGILLAVVHFPGKPGWHDKDQEEAAGQLMDTLGKIETELKNDRIVLVGDLNMNPFDPGMTSSYKLHAVMSRTVARAGQRKVQGKVCRYFYNPMWSCFGDRNPGPPGTYYYAASTPVSYFWHMWDQVLLRPSIMDALMEVRILDSLDDDGRGSLLDGNGRPTLSDHLPILFRLNL